MANRKLRDLTKNNYIILGLLIAILGSCTRIPPTPSELYSKYEGSVVLIRNSYYIKASVNNGLDYYFSIENNIPILQKSKKDAIENASISYGTGFFISENGEIATNRHVVYPTVDFAILNDEINNSVKEVILYLKEVRNKRTKELHSIMDFMDEFKDYINFQKRLELIDELNIIANEVDELTHEIDNLVFNPEKTRVEVERISLGIAYNNSFITKDDDFEECVFKKKSNNEEVDLAIIQLKDKKTPERITSFFDINNLSKDNIILNDKVYIIGYNQGFSLANTKEGIKSQLNEGVITQEPDNSRLLYSIPTLPGSSGSPVFNEWGDLVGINYAKVSGSQGFSFGVPALALTELHRNTDYETNEIDENAAISNFSKDDSRVKTTEVLYGYKLGQYYESVENVFGKPIKVVDDHETGLKHSIYLIEKDTSSYIVFGINKMRIESIQLFSLSNEVNPTFRNVKMGENKNMTIKHLGEPTEVIKNEIGGELLKFENTNFDVEVNKGKLSSIRIWHEPSLYEAPGKDDIPTMEHIKNIVLSGENERISKLLSTAFEYNDDDEKNILFFEYPWEQEIKHDYSRVYEKIIKFIDTMKDKEFEESVRIKKGEGILIVYKYKVPNRIVEVVLKMEYGKYLLWEINNFRDNVE